MTLYLGIPLWETSSFCSQLGTSINKYKMPIGGIGTKKVKCGQI